MLRRALLLAVACGLATPAHALEAENLLVTMPPGYKVGYTNHTPKGVITEMVPAAETVESWTEMVTVQIFFGMKDSVDGLPPAHGEAVGVRLRRREERAGRRRAW